MKRRAMFVPFVLFFSWLTWLSLAASSLLDDFEDTYFITEAGAGESIVLSNSADRTQGSYSLEITYNYTADDPWYKNATIRRNFDTPLDLREMEYVTLDVNVPAAYPEFIITINLVDEKGHNTRFEDYDIFDTATSGWVRRSYFFSDLHKDMWIEAGRTPNLKKITKIVYHIMNESAVSAGTLTFKIDNLKFYSGYGLINERLLEGFETYANNAALSARWVPHPTRLPTVSLETTNPYAGSKSMRLQATIAGEWTNYWATYTFSSPQDFSSALYFKIALHGDSTLFDLWPTPHLYLVDGNGNRAIAYIWNWGEESEWMEIFLPFQNQGIAGYLDASWTKEYDGRSCWLEDRWDGRPWNEDTDLSNITGMMLSIETQRDDTYPISTTIMWDNIIVGYETSPAPPPSTGVQHWYFFE